MNKPNILLMISHDTGRYLGCYGRPVETPNLDGLAAQGVLFDNYFCPAPQCSPSRGSVITGRYPHNHGMIGLAHLGFSIRDGVATLPMELRKEGYQTALIGLSHETIGEPGGTNFSSGKALGYEEVISVPGDRAPAVGERTAAFLREKAKEGGKPFFASVGFFETHRDFDEYEHAADPREKAVPPAYLPDTPDVRDDFALLHGSAKTLDLGVGRILNALKETGLDENTVVIYTTDHGIAFPRAKGTLFDSGLETALIVSWPKQWAGGRTERQLLCNIDLMPTLLELAGAPLPADLDGRSFLPLLEGKEDSVRDHFFCELTWHDLYHPMRGIRTERYKYIRNFEPGPSVYLPLDIHRSLSGRAVRDEYYVPNVPEELYDLSQDPLETNNLAGDPAFRDILLELRERVERRMRETNDPLLKGKVPGVPAPEWDSEYRNGTAYAARGSNASR
ncbi:sulfatase [Paenibacillus naphthalenovorans]|uniref:sulfatase family protein n=1 Tax=Paenibacillus naphthalenovorans TaxID=162209 RepID=UPI0010AFCCD9|nr:sulfatase [Paenibacillus naphthalenovorans]GCL73474.1 sulfatase [Paenibacillus naphthalenovorans]